MDEENKRSDIIHFKMPIDNEKIIKVIGVGGGGGNAVKHMYKEGIHDVSFALCNTDWQAMKKSEIPTKIVLGRNLTKGLGTGNNPPLARDCALESEDEIRAMLSDGTEMAFVTAGMGGGTGTGAAPVIARIAKDMDILTVGIVTIPFLFEGYDKIIQALDGVEEMSKNVDALLVVNNERLIHQQSGEKKTVRKDFAKANDSLTVAAKSISELITLSGDTDINLDFNDVKTTLKDGGIALMSTGYGEGERRFEQAIRNALDSPLLNHNDIRKAQKICFQIVSPTNEEYEILTEELESIKKFMEEFSSKYIKVIWGLAYDDSLDKQLKFTILASGFGLEDILTENEKDAIDSQESEAEQRRIEQGQKRIKKYYGEDEDDPMSHVVILTSEEMDEDKIIALLEENPTYRREPEIIREARRKTVVAVSTGEMLQNGEQPCKISFKKNNYKP